MVKLETAEIEKKNIEFEIFRIGRKYGVKSFDELCKKIENGEVAETTEVLYDLMHLEYLEEQLEKYVRR
jgi:hypothetical protein